MLLGSGWIWPAQSFMNMQLLPEAHNLEHGGWGDSEITWSEVHIVDRRKLRHSAERGSQGFSSIAGLPPSPSSAAVHWPLGPQLPCSISSCLAFLLLRACFGGQTKLG